MKVVIVGGGIGGLSSAVAFHRRGWQVEVLERAPAFTGIGAGLSIQPNGLRALDVLGLGDSLRADGLADPVAGIRDASGRWLIRNDIELLTRRFGQWATVHRADLIDRLRGALPPSALRAAIDVRGVRPDGSVVHEGGVGSADLVVAADGVHSVARRSLWPDLPGPRYAGYTTWRFVAPSHPIEGSVEIWGAGERFGHVPMADGRVYCYVIANALAGSRIGLEHLRERFARWREPIPSLLQSVRPDAVQQHDTYELPELDTYVRGNVALVGDAAHAMTPNLGQGACQAVEDAVTLAAAVDRHGIPAGLGVYDRIRRPRAQMITRRSRQVGAPAHWTSGPLVALRNAVLPYLPAAIFERSLGSTYAWTPYPG